MNSVEISKSRIQGTASISGSKSVANRALFISMLTDGVSKISNIPSCDDSSLMINAATELGSKISKNKYGVVEISGILTKNSVLELAVDTELFCSIAGTTSRFLTSLGLISAKKITISGEGRLLERPMSDLCNALEDLGCEVGYFGKNGCVPFSIYRKNDPVSIVKISGKISSQYISSLMMIAPVLPNGLKIIIKDELVSRSYVDLTASIMSDFGVIAEVSDSEINIPNARYLARDFVVAGDFSSASYFASLPILLGSNLVIKNLDCSSNQGDGGFFEILEKLGANINWIDNGSVKIDFSMDKIPAININMENMPDVSMTLAMILAFADGESIITGLSTLKNKETDRLLALKTEFEKIGIKSEIGDDFIKIYGNSNLKIEKLTKISTYHDHRIAMCFALIGAKCGNIEIENPGVVKKSMPEFWDEMAKVGVVLEHL
jgi:3-phosphoshikimate 1-carboxyvinyltransferase